MKLVLKYIKPYWMFALLAPLFMLLEVFMDLMQPTLMAKIVDLGIAKGNLEIIFQTGGNMILVALLGVLGGIGSSVNATFASVNFSADLRKDLYAKVLSYSNKNIDSLETGNVITRLTNDVVQIEMLLRVMLTIMVRAPLHVVGSIIMAVMISRRLSVVILIVVPLLLGATYIIVKVAYPLFYEVQKKLDRVNVRAQESLSAIRLVKAFVRSDYERESFNKVNDDFMDVSIKAGRVIVFIHPTMQLLLYTGITALLVLGAFGVKDGTLEVGKILAFINYFTQMLWSLLMMSHLLVHFSRARASIARVSEVFNLDNEIKEKDETLSEGDVFGEIEFRNVSFSYSNKIEEAVLKNISLKIEPQKTYVIFGSTGSGKTTLVNLIPRLYEVTEGSVLFDKKKLRDYKKEFLRSNIGFTPQEIVLFSGTISENILYGVKDGEEREAKKYAALAGISDFVESLEEGYNTNILRKGVNLSGGQKQRISIARALAKKPKVLIFDDSLSALDAVTERKVLNTLLNDDELANLTKIIVAQKISVATLADEIVLLDDGEIKGQGTHKELLKENSLYKEIYESQTAEKVDP